MKALLVLFIAAFLSAGPCVAQRVQIDFDKLRLNGLPLYSTKAQVIKQLGKPVKINEPHYDCGSLSSREQGQRLYSLHYRQAVFTGNAKEGYVMEEVTFSAKVPTVLMHGTWKLSEKTTLKDLEQAIGHKLTLHNIRTGKETYEPVVSLGSKGDDGAIFWFGKGHLVRFEYWTPC